jgi:hypothetical protein
MSVTPGPSPDREDLARLLPVPDGADLPADRRHMLKEHLLTSIADDTARLRGRGRRTIGIVIPAGLAAVVAGAVFFAGSSPAPDGRTTAGARGAAPSVTVLPEHLSSVAYTLDRSPSGDIVKITIHGAHGRPDIGRLRRDLARMGVAAQIYPGVPRCAPKIFNLAERDRNGDYIASVPVKFVSRYPETIIFSLDARGGDPLTLSVGSRAGTEPTCGPMPRLNR